VVNPSVVEGHRGGWSRHRRYFFAKKRLGRRFSGKMKNSWDRLCFSRAS